MPGLGSSTAGTTAVTAGVPVGAMASAWGGSADSQDGVAGKAVMDAGGQAEPSGRLWSWLTPELTGLPCRRHSWEN